MEISYFLWPKAIRALACRRIAGSSCRRPTLSSIQNRIPKQRNVIRFLAHGWRLMTKWHCTGGGLSWAADDHHAVPARMESRRHFLPEPVQQQVGQLVAAVCWQEGGADPCSTELAPAPAGGSARHVCDCELWDSCLHFCRGPLAAALPSARSRRTPGRCLGRDASWLRVRSRWRARCTPRMRRPACPLAPPSNGASLEEAAAKRLAALGPRTCLGHGLWRHGASWELGRCSGGSLSLEAANMTR